MPITTLARLKRRLGIPLEQTDEDASLTLFIEQAESACLNLINRSFLDRQITTQLLDGTGDSFLMLRHAPVTAFGTSILTTAGSTVATVGSNDLPYMIAKMPMYCRAFPLGSTIASVDTTAQTITVSAAATSSNASIWAFFGIEVREEVSSDAAFGTREGSFGTATILVPGIDYAPRLDGDNDRTSNSAILERLIGPWTRTRVRGRGTLSTGYSVPLAGRGCVRVTYCAGYDRIPAEIEHAVFEAIGMARNAAEEGRPINSESYQGYNYSAESLSNETAWLGYFGGKAAASLKRYRRISI